MILLTDGRTAAPTLATSTHPAPQGCHRHETAMGLSVYITYMVDRVNHVCKCHSFFLFHL